MTDCDNTAQAIRIEYTDQELVRRILSGGDGRVDEPAVQRAMDCLWQRYRDDIERVIAGELNHARPVEIEDIATEVWLTVLDPNKLCQWRADTPSIRPWMRAIARNQAMDYARRIGDQPGELDGDEREPPDGAEDPEETALARIAEARLLEAIYRCMAGLTDVERLAFSAWLKGDSLTDLAQDLGKKPNAVYQDLYRAKVKVFEQLIRHYRDLLPEEWSDSVPRGEWRRV